MGAIIRVGVGCDNLAGQGTNIFKFSTKRSKPKTKLNQQVRVTLIQPTISQPFSRSLLFLQITFGGAS